ncbi:DgyrCDS14571 [Dimorphilus gyrociliatus]|uniref:DgyrCDS14571 n=1 Tax=Dimorphilus gyrociliatus TaxID=2664684 RepID=A0A7I8WE27_9ANNE|nr:DgyrCDS14571 [Dimorphilus gyrociliatus]
MVKMKEIACIKKSAICDGIRNCIDYSDEDCNGNNCKDNEIFCDRKCVGMEYQCDLRPDCQGFEDEKYSICKRYPGYILVFKKFSTYKSCQIFAKYFDVQASKYDKKCHLRYNSIGDLLTKVHYPFQDLFFCYTTHCNIGEYQCYGVNFCIPMKNVCDGEKHCDYGDDEDFCTIGKK